MTTKEAKEAQEAWEVKENQDLEVLVQATIKAATILAQDILINYSHRAIILYFLKVFLI